MASIRKRGNSYQIRVGVGYDTNGKQVVRSVTWTPSPDMTRRQIDQELMRQVMIFEDKCRNGISSSTLKFQELAEKWFEDYAVHNMKKSSVQRLRGVTARVYAEFGHMRLNKITHGHVQAFIDDLSKNGRSFLNGKPLSRKTILHHLNLLTDIFKYAIRLEMIDTNPCKNIYIPREEKKEKDMYTVEEMRQLFELAEKYSTIEYRAFLTLAVYGGFRLGEITGLEWKDIDWNNNIVHIRRTSNYTATDGTYVDTPKTKKSVRSLKLPELVFDILKELSDKQKKSKEELGSQWIDSDRLFVTKFGVPIYNGEPYKWQKKLTEEHGMRFCDIHSLRHFNASVLINSGVDILAVSKALGHSCVSTTTNIYCHEIEEAQCKIGNAIADILNLAV